MRKKIALGGLMMVATVVLAEPAMAQELSSSGVMNDVLKRFHDAAATWGPAIESAASRLLWTLVVISMVWTFGMMALRKADIDEFFAEFVRFTIFTGFFWWLLVNATTGMNIAGTMVESLQMLGAQAGGLSDSKLGPSSILDLGFELYHKTVQATSELGWRQFATALVMELLAIAVLIVMALIAINLLLVMASAWILMYAGIFFLGFGGSRWTSDMAINYYKTVLGVASQLMAMVLLVAIGKQFINHYYAQISEGVTSQELAVMLVIALILLFLVNKVPSMISGIVTGASLGAIGGAGSFGAGAAMGAAMTAASMATGGAAMAGKAMMGAATGAVGGASAIQAAFQKASASMGAGGNMPSMGSIVNGGSSGGGEAGTAGSSPFARAAGTASELAKGVGSQMQQGFQERVAETTGGKLAAGIRASMEPEGSAEQSAGGQQFEDNSLGGNAGTSDKSSGGWINQTGGFSALSEADQAQAMESHAQWQAKSDGNTFGVEDYVSYAQEPQQERNAEVASFVNNENKNDRG
ncbi:type IV secretion system protein VirB6/type IV secretion system protein TrbL [Nitrosomonas eutropha]|uniref:Type IV secretion system protein VirB6/type IV secretion system protein TrbL n=1 Tax=Nitrosomonas eutropha TaxID=916 RepID=A0A1I7H6I4_9PROT|nr:P-type conjugative transfer protein TrbL [Nitrosomonas eutropha]SFU56234.1 type IV secretion system protein VirB6/type IV secretion system protein TrbL [Nitrosomonas eutropha]